MAGICLCFGASPADAAGGCVATEPLPVFEKSTSRLFVATFLVALGIVFEHVQHGIVQSADRYTRPVVDSLFQELTLLGFVGLFLFVVEQSGLLEAISASVFGKDHVGNLTLHFHQIHMVLFLVMMIYLATVLLLVRLGVGVTRNWRKYEQEAHFREKLMQKYAEEHRKAKQRRLDVASRKLSRSATFLNKAGRSKRGGAEEEDRGQSVRKGTRDSVLYSMIRLRFIYPPGTGSIASMGGNDGRDKTFGADAATQAAAASDAVDARLGSGHILTARNAQRYRQRRQVVAYRTNDTVRVEHKASRSSSTVGGQTRKAADVAAAAAMSAQEGPPAPGANLGPSPRSDVEFAQDGDMLIISEDHSVTVCDGEKFRAMYAPVEGVLHHYRVRAPVLAACMSTEFEAQDAAGHMTSGNEGDWLVQHADGSQVAIPNEAFQKLYEPVGNNKTRDRTWDLDESFDFSEYLSLITGRTLAHMVDLQIKDWVGLELAIIMVWALWVTKDEEAIFNIVVMTIGYSTLGFVLLLYRKLLWVRDQLACIIVHAGDTGQWSVASGDAGDDEVGALVAPITQTQRNSTPTSRAVPVAMASRRTLGPVVSERGLAAMAASGGASRTEMKAMSSRTVLEFSVEAGGASRRTLPAIVPAGAGAPPRGAGAAKADGGARMASAPRVTATPEASGNGAAYKKKMQASVRAMRWTGRPVWEPKPYAHVFIEPTRAAAVAALGDAEAEPRARAATVDSAPAAPPRKKGYLRGFLSDQDEHGGSPEVHDKSRVAVSVHGESSTASAPERGRRGSASHESAKEREHERIEAEAATAGLKELIIPPRAAIADEYAWQTGLDETHLPQFAPPPYLSRAVKERTRFWKWLLGRPPNQHENLFWFDHKGVEILFQAMRSIPLFLSLYVSILAINMVTVPCKSLDTLGTCIWQSVVSLVPPVVCAMLLPHLFSTYVLVTNIEMMKKRRDVMEVVRYQRTQKAMRALKMLSAMKVHSRRLYSKLSSTRSGSNVSEAGVDTAASTEKRAAATSDVGEKRVVEGADAKAKAGQQLERAGVAGPSGGTHTNGIARDHSNADGVREELSRTAVELAASAGVGRAEDAEAEELETSVLKDAAAAERDAVADLIESARRVALADGGSTAGSDGDGTDAAALPGTVVPGQQARGEGDGGSDADDLHVVAADALADLGVDGATGEAADVKDAAAEAPGRRRSILGSFKGKTRPKTKVTEAERRRKEQEDRVVAAEMSLRGAATRVFGPEDSIPYLRRRLELQEVFKLFDRDHDGTVDVADMTDLFELLGLSDMSAAAARQVIKEVDVSRRGVIEFDDFFDWMAFHDGGVEESTEEINRFVFNIIDTDSSGEITVEELKATLASLGEDMSESDVVQIVREADTDGSGTINLHEFTTLLSRYTAEAQWAGAL